MIKSEIDHRFDLNREKDKKNREKMQVQILKNHLLISKPTHITKTYM